MGRDDVSEIKQAGVAVTKKPSGSFSLHQGHSTDGGLSKMTNAFNHFPCICDFELTNQVALFNYPGLSAFP